ncbi:FAD-binding monooxygenase [Larsenimonas suaedae]|uniref:Alkyl hydroperoxide reductase subunit F n=1 Tax=Larsenimonas suaedae TaxID=1851019 RepID=A0ABU1GVY5_9GAMM|nr:FAD-binding monooxygenase [Larsenimonas suaedae]MCM2973317.1 FAD-binding monooxygenase [Larsenimonas suaedae]MDR5896210.1 FAD-binding monooxygenase [Larsenimonas suaedae]
MQFHHHGYVSGDPRVQPALGEGLERSDALPDEVDVLIVGTGPAGMIMAAQLAQFPHIRTRIIERRAGRLEIGHADGIQARSVETFQAFGFAGRITAEAYRITEMAFWKPDPDQPEHIIRTARTLDDPEGISEFPHLIVNQARVLDYLAESAANGPARIRPDFGIEFKGLEVDGEGDYPVSVALKHVAGPDEGRERTVRAKYVVGCDGARSGVRSAIGCTLAGDQANHAWGVMDVLARTDFPDIRTKCAIQSHSGGSILLIPREGGHLFRMYVDLGEVPADGGSAVRNTPIEQIIAKANDILTPYTLDVKDVAWHSVYEVGHRLTDRFDDVKNPDSGRLPRVFITGDACHTHSAKAGQGMNVSMQDGFNLGWKLGYVLSNRSPASLLSTYSAERQVVAKNLIDFDKQWSTMMAKRPEEFENPGELEEFYTRTIEFPAGFMTEYEPSLITNDADHQALATGFPIGKRFKSAMVSRVCDGNPLQLGHQAKADGRWRLYVFADAATPEADSKTRSLAEWLAHSSDSPLNASFPNGSSWIDWFDIKVIYQQRHEDIAIQEVPSVFTPEVGPFELIDLENVFGVAPGDDIFDARGIDRDGAVVVVRPDQYVADVLPLSHADRLSELFLRLQA